MKSNRTLSTPWLIVTIALLSMIGPFSIDTYLPSFPTIEAEFIINRGRLSQSLGIYLAASAISTLFWGPLSDRIGRRRVIMSSLGFYLAASLGCAFSQDYTTFLLFRVFQGIAASGGMVAGRAMIRDAHNSQDAHRAMAYVMMLFALAPAIAPVIGGWLHDIFGWRSVFYFLALYGGIILVMTARFLNETLAHHDRQSFHPLRVSQHYFGILCNHRFQALVFAIGSCFGGLFLYIAGAPTVIFDFLGLGSSHFILQFGPMTMGIIIGAFISGKLAHRWPTRTIVNLAFFVMGLAVLLNLAQTLWLEPAVFTLIAPQALYALGVALMMPGITILALDCFPKNRGAASAVQAFIQLMITAVVASVVLPLLSVSIIKFTLTQMLLFGMSVLLWQWTQRRHS